MEIHIATGATKINGEHQTWCGAAVEYALDREKQTYYVTNTTMAREHGNCTDCIRHHDEDKAPAPEREAIPETSAHANMTLQEARDWVRARVEKGVRCPCCTDHVKIYKRPISCSMASGLIKLYRAAEQGAYIHAPSIMNRNECGDFAKLRYWDLIQGSADYPPKEKKDTGKWTITDRGCKYVLAELEVPKHARIYGTTFLGWSEDTPMVNILDALGERFDYSDLMSR